MDEKAIGTTKPLRSALNKQRDLLNTYLKNEENKTHSQQYKDKKDMDLEQNGLEEIEQDTNTEEDGHLVLNQEDAHQILDRFEQLEKEKNELKEQLLRNVAELENFRRRAIREKQEMIEYANERLLFKFLPLVDDFEKAIGAAKKSSDFDALVAGLEMIYNKMLKSFEEAGVKRMEEAVGKPFDVNFHDALLTMNSDLPEGYVVQEVEPGYMIKEKVLRHSKVVTSNGIKPEVTTENA